MSQAYSKEKVAEMMAEADEALKHVPRESQTIQAGERVPMPHIELIVNLLRAEIKTLTAELAASRKEVELLKSERDHE